MIASLAMTMTKAGSGSLEDIHPDYLPKSFFANKEVLEDIATRVIELEDKYQVLDECRQIEKRLNFSFPLVAYEWVKGTKFSEICNVSFQEPGNMITALRSLVKLCEELGLAYKEIENTETSEKFTKISEKMKRDILFLDSLYYIKEVKEDLAEQAGDELGSDDTERYSNSLFILTFYSDPDSDDDE